jgi:hypothetical protein
MFRTSLRLGRKNWTTQPAPQSIHPRYAVGRRPQCQRLTLELLESRCLLSYTITDLGTLPGDLSSTAYGTPCLRLGAHGSPGHQRRGAIVPRWCFLPFSANLDLAVE